MQNLLEFRRRLNKSTHCCLQMQGYSWSHSFLMFKELGFDTKTRETTKLLKPKRAFILLETIRMRDL